MCICLNINRAISLKPKNAVTITVPDIPSLKARIGVDMPWIVQKLLGLMISKFFNAANEAGTQLIAYATGGNNGRMLQQACDEISALGDKFVKKPARKIRDLQNVKQNGLSKDDIGTVILFS